MFSAQWLSGGSSSTGIQLLSVGMGGDNVSTQRVMGVLFCLHLVVLRPGWSGTRTLWRVWPGYHRTVASTPLIIVAGQPALCIGQHGWLVEGLGRRGGPLGDVPQAAELLAAPGHQRRCQGHWLKRPSVPTRWPAPWTTPPCGWWTCVWAGPGTPCRATPSHPCPWPGAMSISTPPAWPGSQRFRSQCEDATVRAWDVRMGARSLFLCDPYGHEGRLEVGTVNVGRVFMQHIRTLTVNLAVDSTLP